MHNLWPSIAFDEKSGCTYHLTKDAKMLLKCKRIVFFKQLVTSEPQKLLHCFRGTEHVECKLVACKKSVFAILKVLS